MTLLFSLMIGAHAFATVNTAPPGWFVPTKTHATKLDLSLPNNGNFNAALPRPKVAREKPDLVPLPIEAPNVYTVRARGCGFSRKLQMLVCPTPPSRRANAIIARLNNQINGSRDIREADSAEKLLVARMLMDTLGSVAHDQNKANQKDLLQADLLESVQADIASSGTENFSAFTVAFQKAAADQAISVAERTVFSADDLILLALTGQATEDDFKNVARNVAEGHSDDGKTQSFDLLWAVRRSLLAMTEEGVVQPNEGLTSWLNNIHLFYEVTTSASTDGVSISPEQKVRIQHSAPQAGDPHAKSTYGVGADFCVKQMGYSSGSVAQSCQFSRRYSAQVGADIPDTRYQFGPNSWGPYMKWEITTNYQPTDQFNNRAVVGGEVKIHIPLPLPGHS